MQRKNGLPPIHPGEIIKQDILPSVGLSVTAAAKALGVSRQMLHDILAERKPLSAVMCLKVSRLFGGSPELMDALAGSLRPEEGGAKQEGDATRRADRAYKADNNYSNSARLRRARGRKRAILQSGNGELRPEQ